MEARNSETPGGVLVCPAVVAPAWGDVSLFEWPSETRRRECESARNEELRLQSEAVASGDFAAYWGYERPAPPSFSVILEWYREHGSAICAALSAGAAHSNPCPVPTGPSLSASGQTVTGRLMRIVDALRSGRASHIDPFGWVVAKGGGLLFLRERGLCQ